MHWALFCAVAVAAVPLLAVGGPLADAVTVMTVELAADVAIPEAASVALIVELSR
jgi:hypothetical protein